MGATPTMSTKEVYMARPVKVIDESIFEELCSIQCTLSEIAGVFRCSEDTIQNWCKSHYGECFSVVYKKYSEDGKTSLRRYQMELAKTNATMAIWLGKQYLGQQDRQEIAVSDDSKLKAMTNYLGGIKNGKTKDIGRKDAIN